MSFFSKIWKSCVYNKKSRSKYCKEPVNGHRMNSKVKHYFHKQRNNGYLNQVLNLNMMMFWILNEYLKWFYKYENNRNNWEYLFSECNAHLPCLRESLLRHLSKMWNMYNDCRNYFITKKECHIKYIRSDDSHEYIDRAWNK